MGVPREDGFDITAASEVMAILCLSRDYADLKERLGRILVGFTARRQRPCTPRDLKAEGAMAALLRDALLPNLVQTTEGAPALVHGGPFGNIAHGCNSLVATRLAMRRADFVFTEAGFGFDLGAEKFLDIKCRAAGIWPHAVVLVATLRALKFHGGVPAAEAAPRERARPWRGAWRTSRSTSTACASSASSPWWRSTCAPATRRTELDYVLDRLQRAASTPAWPTCSPRAARARPRSSETIVARAQAATPQPRFIYELERSARREDPQDRARRSTARPTWTSRSRRSRSSTAR